jgi:hypothetical protein
VAQAVGGWLTGPLVVFSGLTRRRKREEFAKENVAHGPRATAVLKAKVVVSEGGFDEQ